MPSNGKLDVALLAVPESTASTLYGMFDVLQSAGRDWSGITEGVPGDSSIVPRIVSADGREFDTGNGLRIAPGASFASCPRPDVVAIPDLAVLPSEDVGGRYEDEAAWLKALDRAGVTFAAACTGALLLAEAGLLDGLDATTHWAYCDTLAERYPRVRVHPNRALVVSGGGRYMLAGGGTSWHDLALFLIARFVGAEEAMRVARMQLLDWHHIGQQPFANLARCRQTDDAVVARCQEWVARHYDQEAPVAAMTRLSGLAERSFKRRFTQATGMTPLEYVHALRLEETKHLLETSALPIEAIAGEVGYGDASFFSRLFRRKVGLTPAQYRKRFKALRLALEQDSRAAPRTAQRRA